MTRFDDRVDAPAMLVNFADLMSQDARKLADQQHSEWLKAELPKFHQSPSNRMFGGQTQGWIARRVIRLG